MAKHRTTASSATNGKTEQNGSRNKTENGHKNGDVIMTQPSHGLFYSLFNFTVVPLFLIIACPNAVLLIWYTATKCGGSYLMMSQKLTENGLLNGLRGIWAGVEFANPVICSIIAGYMLFALLLMIILPGPTGYGPVSPKGNTPVYKDNGFFCFVVTIITFCALTYVLKTQYGVSPTIIYDRFNDVLATLHIFSLIFCAFLYMKGLFFPSSNDSGSSGNPIFDYYWGTELYPRILGIDVKVFTNCRFGMTVWPLLILIFALKSYELHGFVDSMWVSVFLHMVYFTKFFWWELGYMRTIDIMMDRAGFYICWGCLVFIPGLYTVTNLYMVNNPAILGPTLSIIILVLGTGSIVINYLADWQKQEVRATNGQCKIWGKKPDVIRAKYTTDDGKERESLLLVSGYWGIARHFHYIPELALAFFWCLPGLFNHVMCYTYFLWLCILLTHRTFRDDQKCSAKYGQYWIKYQKKVPYKMIPGIF